MSASDDWLQAELSAVWSPRPEFFDDDRAFRARISLPGFGAEDIRVSVTPNAVIIRAQTRATRIHGSRTSTGSQRRRSGGQWFRRFDLPRPIDVNKVSASLHGSVLQVTAPRGAGNMPRGARNLPVAV